MPNKKNDSASTAAAGGDEDLFRLGMLVVGFPRQPFTIQVTRQEQILVWLPVWNHLKMDEMVKRFGDFGGWAQHVKPRFFRAIRRRKQHPGYPYRYLRVDDPEVDALLKVQGEDVLAAFVNHENEVSSYDDLTTVLTAEPTTNWAPDPSREEIHILMVFGRAKDQGRKGDDCIPLFHSMGVPRPQLCYNGRMDTMLHKYPWEKSSLRMRVFNVLHPGNKSECSIGQLPPFDRIQLRRRLCKKPSHWQPTASNFSTELPLDKKTKKENLTAWGRLLRDPNPWRKMDRGKVLTLSPPRLCELAERVVFHTLLTQSPQFLDPVDCVMEASLYLKKEKVFKKVLCFVKLQRPGHIARPKTSVWSDYINPRMLEQLQSIARIGNWTRPLLVVIAATNPENLLLHPDSISTTIPTAAVHRERFVGNCPSDPWLEKDINLTG